MDVLISTTAKSQRCEFRSSNFPRGLKHRGAPCTQRMSGTRIGEESHPPRSRRVKGPDRHTHRQKNYSPKRPHSHLRTATFLRFRRRPGHSPSGLPTPGLLRAWSPSCHGKDAHSWTTKQGLETHVEMHSTGLLQRQVTSGCKQVSPDLHLFREPTTLSLMLSCFR